MNFSASTSCDRKDTTGEVQGGFSGQDGEDLRTDKGRLCVVGLEDGADKQALKQASKNIAQSLLTAMLL